jgi:tRNA uridine 5-carboxymethylaminomethyl modification enzyme
MRQDQRRALPAGLDYSAIAGLSAELRTKLSSARPADLAQAARIDGMTPAALVLLLAHAKRAAA